ncbi:MAG: transposase, partial [Myxococcota bacterium]
LGTFLFCVPFLPLYVVYRIKHGGGIWETLEAVATGIALFFLAPAFLFKLQHWPGASFFTVIGISLAVCVLAPLVAISFYLHQERRVALNGIHLLIGLAGVCMVLALNVSWNVLMGHVVNEELTTRSNLSLQQGNELLANVMQQSTGDQALLQQKAVPVLDAFQAWLEEQHTYLLSKSAIGQAVSYTLKLWPRLRLYTKDGRLQIDNNLIENAIRPLALGRKNYLFAGSHQAAQRAAMMYSFFATCKVNGVEPYQWLKDVLDRIPEHKANRLAELLPLQENA